MRPDSVSSTSTWNAVSDRPAKKVQKWSVSARPSRIFTKASAWTWGASNLARGKVLSATRHNYIPTGGADAHARVLTTYEYYGKAGRTSARITDIYDVGTLTQYRTDKLQVVYDDLGNVTSTTYPVCTAGNCTGQGTTRTVANTYTSGFPMAVTGFATFTYHPNMTLSKIDFQNGVDQNFGLDPWSVQRPYSISTANLAIGSTAWNTGNFTYDGAGNITRVGNEYYIYDKAQRLAQSRQYLLPNGSGTAVTQTFAYDVFGNLTSISGSDAVLIPTTPSTNRLSVGTATYDASGNVLTLPGKSWTYDKFSMPVIYTSEGTPDYHLYDINDERVYSVHPGAEPVHYIRDLNERLVRVFRRNAGVWTLEDKIHSPSGKVIAGVTAGVTSYFHTDHLGTVRQVTNASAGVSSYHVYYPYGREATSFSQTTERIRFTGHERDLRPSTIPASPNDDLDYMHARYTYPLYGRFLAVDPARESAEVGVPQSWNRYSYVRGNPIKYVDPDGRAALLKWGAKALLKGGNLAADLHALKSDLEVAFDSNASASDRWKAGASAAAGVFFFNARDVRQAGELLGIAGSKGDDAVDAAQKAKAAKDVHGGLTTADEVLRGAESWLGKGYKEIGEGVFRSSDGKRQFRMTTGDLGDGRRGAHVHFEKIARDGRTIVENSHVYLMKNPR